MMLNVAMLYEVHITVCMELRVACVISQPVYTFIKPSLHHLDFFLEIFLRDHNKYVLSTEPARFGERFYFTTEGPKAHVRVVVQQSVESLYDVHLLLTPLTCAQFMELSNQSGSILTLPSIHLKLASATAGDNITGDDRQDFNNSVRHLFFPANLSYDAEEQHVDISVFDDVVDEYVELFFIVLDVDRNLTDVDVAFTPKIALVFIADDDC